MALHRARDVAQHHERARPLDLAPPDPGQDLATVAEVRPEHRPRREASPVPVQLVAAGPAQLQFRLEQVDEALGIPELLGGHSIEVAVAHRLGAAVGVGRDRDDVGGGAVIVGIAVRWNWDPLAILGQVRAFIAGHGGILRRALVRRNRLGTLFGAGGLEVGLERAPPPVPIKDAIVDGPIIPSSGEHGGPGGPDDLPVADVDDAERAREVDLGPDIDRQSRSPQLAPEADGPGEEPMSVDGLAGSARNDRGVVHQGT